MSKLSSFLPNDIKLSQQYMFLSFAVVIILSIWGAVALETWILLLLPFLLIGFFQAIVDYQKIFLLMWATVPISREVYFSNGFGTDLPVEPLMIGLTLIYGLKVLHRPQTLEEDFCKHPIALLLILHLIWIAFATLYSANFVFSFKFFLAKMWYVTAFFFLTGHIVKDMKALKQWFWVFLIPLVFATTKVIVHHAYLDLGFKEINIAVLPFFRNHVNYAAILALALPIAWFFRHLYQKWSIQWWIIWVSMGILFFGLLFAYTRAAYVALVLAIMAYWVSRLRLMKIALVLGSVLAIAIVGYLANNNKYLDLVPKSNTVAHKNFDDIVEATYKLEDVSTMERYYRWIAGVRMAQEDLWTGFGPNNFYTYYKEYALHRFETYVSDNPEQSTIHNYYLLLLVEQGIPGMLIFLALNFAVLIYSEKLYHEVKDKDLKHIVMSMLLVYVVILAFLLMNDMIETDKVGSLFFFSMAMLILVQRWDKQKKNAELPFPKK